jgi:hypothetical protein
MVENTRAEKAAEAAAARASTLLWRAADRLGDAAVLLDRASGRVAGLGHWLLDAYCDIVEVRVQRRIDNGTAVYVDRDLGRWHGDARCGGAR